MAVADAVLIFVLSIIVGTIAILVGARLLIDADAGVPNATVTALAGALVFAVSSLFLDWLPVVGVLVTLVVWIVTINWRYPGGWGIAAVIGVFTWLAAVVIVAAFAVFGIVAPDTLGLPGL